ncbi:hypothetical protein B9Z19DRAFT_1075649 [Tuber borchii]|uniref:Zn(2)-C6 fungal-type domain-containing protein n=1 Tax=Tuber borchii TaxID=42251 RepID=A0A2T7A335_TUBBO|nr:hypothetical protein B9Z19DRAFT_1075649 [Tuber borchii]
MPPKRMHTKSRNGCMTCRRRRVKCDEIRPICSNCTRRELDCVYAAYCPPGRPGISNPPLSPRLRTLPLPLPLQESRTPASTKPRRSSTTNNPSAATLAALAKQFDALILEARAKSPSPLPRISLSKGDLDNLSLLHHFTIRTYNTLTNDGTREDIFRVMYPRIAFQNELTMYSLLAVTALHRSKTAGASLVASRYQIIAASYFDRALSSLRIAILDSSRNATALFAASTLIAIYGLGCHTTGSEPNHIPRVFTWIPLVKGIKTIIKQWWAPVKQGPLARLTEQGALELIEVDNGPLPLPASLFNLALETPPTSNTPYNGDEIVDAVSASIYKHVLGELRTSWTNFWATGHRTAICIQWLVLAPDEYVIYLMEGRPRALVIFCYFLCMIKKLDGLWWIKGSAEETFIQIEGKLNTRWKEQWLKWPKSIIMGDCEVVGES